MAASNASFALLKPLGGVVPVVLNTKSCPAMRGRLARIARTGSARCTICALPFFAREPGNVQIHKSAETSDHRIAATSSRR